MKMKKLIIKGFIILLFQFGSLLTFINFSFAYDLNEYFSLHQGNKWEYKVVKDEKTRVEKFEIIGEEIIGDINTVRMFNSDSGNGYDCLAVDSEGVKQYKTVSNDGQEIFNPPRTMFTNLEVGEEKQYTISLIMYDIYGTEIRVIKVTEEILLESTVADVVVPAGEFHDCLRFSSTLNYYFTGEYGVNDCTFWLARGIGRVKQSCFNSEYIPAKKEQKMEIKIFELISANVDGQQIGSPLD